MSDAPPSLLVSGDPRHGVVRFAGELAAAVRATCPSTTVLADAIDTADTAASPAGEPLHVHFADRLWGPDPRSAADRIRRLAHGRRLTATLHDVPQRSDGDARARRAAAYRDVVACCHGVVVSSEHERSLLVEGGMADDPGAVAVIPLPVMAPAGPPVDGVADDAPRHDEVAILGYVYPGKGHAEAIDAVAGLPEPRPVVRALGAASRGHEADLAELVSHARRLGVDFAATGWLSEAELVRRARGSRVPLAAHAHVSASGSINSWVAVGRVPLVADSRYARELDHLRPGTIRRYPPDGLRAAIRAARADEASTRREPGVDTRPHLDDVAERYRRWWAAG